MIDCLKRADSVGQAVLALLCGGTGSAGWAGAHCRDGRALFSHRRTRAWLQLFPIGLDVRAESPGLKSDHSSSARFPPFPPLSWRGQPHHQAAIRRGTVTLRDPARLGSRDSIRSFAPWGG
jgi:hypothetical protein